MSEVPDGWESLNGEFIDTDIHGDFMHAWGKPAGADGQYDVIVAVYVHHMTKYGRGAVYKIRNPAMGRTLTDKLKGLISSSENPKPIVSTQEEADDTTVTRTSISVGSPEEALEKAQGLME